MAQRGTQPAHACILHAFEGHECDHKNLLAWNLRGVVSAVYDLCIKTYRLSNWRGCGREMLILEFAWLCLAKCKILLSVSANIQMVVKAVSWSKSRFEHGWFCQRLCILLKNISYWSKYIYPQHRLHTNKHLDLQLHASSSACPLNWSPCYPRNILLCGPFIRDQWNGNY